MSEPDKHDQCLNDVFGPAEKHDEEEPELEQDEPSADGAESGDVGEASENGTSTKVDTSEEGSSEQQGVADEVASEGEDQADAQGEPNDEAHALVEDQERTHTDERAPPIEQTHTSQPAGKDEKAKFDERTISQDQATTPESSSLPKEAPTIVETTPHRPKYIPRFDKELQWYHGQLRRARSERKAEQDPKVLVERLQKEADLHAKYTKACEDYFKQYGTDKVKEDMAKGIDPDAVVYAYDRWRERRYHLFDARRELARLSK